VRVNLPVGGRRCFDIHSAVGVAWMSWQRVLHGFRTTGPFDTAAAAYEDRAANYVTSEAIDYTAASIVLLAVLD
jgi:hypothetical protein